MVKKVVKKLGDPVGSKLQRKGSLVEGMTLTKTEEIKYKKLFFEDRLRQVEEKMLSGSLADVGLTTSALGTIYTRTSSYRADVYKEVDSILDFYMVRMILKQIAEDTLTPSLGGEILNISSTNTSLQKPLEEFSKRFPIDDIINSIKFSFLAYGDYTLRIEKQVGKGVTQIRDDVVQENIFALTDQGEIQKYLTLDEKGTLELHEKTKFIKFMLPGIRRVDIAAEVAYITSGGISGVRGRNYKKSILPDGVPPFLRVGESLIFPLIPKIRELQLLEALVPATKIAKLTQGSLVGVPLGSSISLEKMLRFAKDMGNVLNKAVGIDKGSGHVTVENIMSESGRLKVVPLPGDKGNLVKLDYKQDEPDELLASIEDLRRVILTSMGLPYEIFFSGEESRGEVLKKHARYLRILKGIQMAISQGIKSLVQIHLANLDSDKYKFNSTDIEITFRNKLVSIESLDELEYTAQLMNTLSTILEFYDNEKLRSMGVVDEKEVAAYLKTKITDFGLGDTIDLKKFKEPEKPTEEKPTEEPTEDPAEEQDDSDNDDGEL